MRYSLIPFFAFLLLISCTDQSQSEEKENTINNEVTMKEMDTLSDYNESYAEQLGADEYGMRNYVMAFLKKGPNRDQDSLEKSRLQRAHLDNILRLAEEGKLVLAGPFNDDGEIRGIYIFNVENLQEAEELTKTDPAVQAGSLVMELHPWYGSAAVMEVNRIHKQISKISI